MLKESKHVNKDDEEMLNFVQHKKYLTELLDFCLYGNCLQEETAQKYFSYLLQNWNDFNLKQSREKLDTELDSINTNRFNDQIRNQRIKNDYFEGKTKDEFKSEFMDFLKTQRNITPKLNRQIMIVFKDYIEKFDSSKLKKYANWRA